MPFLISSLAISKFEHLFDLSTAELASQQAIRMVATTKPGFPCRVSLVDAEIGEDVILVNYEHQAAATPFRSSHAVYVRRLALQTNLKIDEVPELFQSRTLSLRAFDEFGMMIAADLADGPVLAQCIEALFEDRAVSYIHLHFAKPGCYAARVDRALLDS